MRHLPLSVPLEQCEYVGRAGIGTSQFARPAFDFKMNNRDTLDDFNARKARTDVRRRTVLSDPLENVFDRAGIFDSLTVTGDGCGRMKSRAHQIPVAGPGR